MIDIQVIDDEVNNELLDPIHCWGSKHGEVFQQYFEDKPQKCFYIGCGKSENVINIWFEEEEGVYRLSSDDKNSLLGLVSSVKVKKIEADIDVTLLVR